jgi:hypothetical protein
MKYKVTLSDDADEVVFEAVANDKRLLDDVTDVVVTSFGKSLFRKFHEWTEYGWTPDKAKIVYPPGELP